MSWISQVLPETVFEQTYQTYTHTHRENKMFMLSWLTVMAQKWNVELVLNESYRLPKKINVFQAAIYAIERDVSMVDAGVIPPSNVRSYKWTVKEIKRKFCDLLTSTHNWSLQSFSQDYGTASHTTHVVCVKKKKTWVAGFTFQCRLLLTDFWETF